MIPDKTTYVLSPDTYRGERQGVQQQVSTPLTNTGIESVPRPSRGGSNEGSSVIAQYVDENNQPRQATFLVA